MRGCTQEGCDSAACAQPLVDLGVLTVDAAPVDVQEATLLDAIDRSAPMLPEPGMMAMGGTPVAAALDGALRFASAHQAVEPEGAPSYCS